MRYFALAGNGMSTNPGISSDEMTPESGADSLLMDCHEQDTDHPRSAGLAALVNER